MCVSVRVSVCVCVLSLSSIVSYGKLQCMFSPDRRMLYHGVFVRMYFPLDLEVNKILFVGLEVTILTGVLFPSPTTGA